VIAKLKETARSLKGRIAVAIGLYVIVALGLNTAFLARLFESDAVEQSVHVQADVANRAALRIDERIADRFNLLEAVARQIPAGTHLDPERVAQILTSKPNAIRQFQAIFIASPNGDLVGRIEDGRLMTDRVSVRDRAYFRQMQETGRPVISDPIISRFNGRPVVVMARPTFDEDGRMSTVVGATLALDGPSGLVEVDHRSLAQSETFVIDTAGRIVGHADPALLLTSASDHPLLERFFERVGRRLRGDDAHGAIGIDGHVIAWRSIGETRWVLLEVASTSDVRAAIARSRLKAVVASVGLAVLGALGALGLCALLFRPLSQLRGRAMRVLTEPVDLEGGWPTGEDEIGAVSRALQHILRERAAAEAGTQRTIAQLQAILDNASVGIAFTRNFRFELVSRSMAELTGYSRAQLFGRPTRLLVRDDETYERLLAVTAESVQATGRFDIEIRIARADGSEVWVRAIGTLLDRAEPLSGTIWIVEDITEARRMREQLSWSATRDPLTELLNRREFETRLQAYLDQPERSPAALLYIDLDRFKPVNDTGGHAAGDRLLCDLARLLEAQVRQADHVARLGGDEFAILLAGCPLEQAVIIAERIRETVHAYRLELDGRVHSVGASIGLARIDERTTTLARLMRDADAACYAAKESGRNAVRTVAH